MNSILDLGNLQNRFAKSCRFLHQLWSKRPDVRSLCFNLGYRVWTAPDGFPIPNARLLYAVQLSREAAWYLHSGRLCCNGIRYALSRNGYSLDDFETILDFGCGCGRIIRHWSELAKHHQLYGSDVNSKLIAWDQKHLARIADYRTNGLEPPLSYPDGLFSLSTEPPRLTCLDS
jgi:2-polyprenyl-3-methyl-5-hydroxy-6-metoxy-1,4-benzoquinol methylase